MKFLIMLLVFPLSLFAGPYRAVMHKFRTFGGLATGFLTWVGAIVIMPAMIYGFAMANHVSPDYVLWLFRSRFYEAFRRDLGFRELSYAFGFWAILLAATLVQMLVRWCSKHPVRDRWRNNSWMGWGEFFCIAIVSGLGLVFHWRIVSAFLTVGYLCSTLQMLLFRLHKQLSDKPRPEKIAKQKTVTAANFQQQVMPDGQVIYVQTRSPSFTSRVMSHMVASWLMSSMWGFVNFNVICLVLAVPLWFLGWKLEAPSGAKEEGRHFMAWVKEVMGDKREEFSERLSTAREGAREKFDDLKEEAHAKVVALKEDAREKVDEFKDRMEDKRQEMKAEVKRQRNAAFWSMFGY